MVVGRGTAAAPGADGADDGGHSEETLPNPRWIDWNVQARWLELSPVSPRWGGMDRCWGAKRLLVLGLTLDMIST